MSSKIGALATPLKSPCDQRERGRERAYEQSECASRVSGANDKRRRGESRGGARASVAEAVRVSTRATRGSVRISER